MARSDIPAHFASVDAGFMVLRSAHELRRAVNAFRAAPRYEVLAPDARRVRIRWLLHPAADPASVRVEGEGRLVEARVGEPAGWFPPAYGEPIASRCVEAEREVREGRMVVTEIRNETL